MISGPDEHQSFNLTAAYKSYLRLSGMVLDENILVSAVDFMC